ncbi:MAG: hypothetical protein Q9160_003087 [Pyrenula sp. 1 TL-2023]
MVVKSMTELLLMYKQKCDECDEAKDCLHYALDTVDTLEFEIETIKDRTIKILGRLAELDDDLESFPPLSKQSNRWIADLWLRLSENESMFGSIEDLWEQNVENPQKALAQLSKLKNWEDLRDNEWIWCCLLEAVIYIHSGLSDDALALLNTALRRCKDHKYTQLRGVAHFFRARVFIGFDKYRTAYWDLCQAAGTEGYLSKVEDWIKIAQGEMQKSGTSIDVFEQLQSEETSLDRVPHKMTYEEVVDRAKIDPATDRLPFMKTENEEEKAAAPVAKTKSEPKLNIDTDFKKAKPVPASKNSFDQAIQSFGPAAELLASTPKHGMLGTPASRGHSDNSVQSGNDNPYRKSVAEQDYYDKLPADVRSGMPLHEKRSIESVPGLKNKVLNGSLVSQSTGNQSPVDIQHELTPPGTGSATTQLAPNNSRLTSADEREESSMVAKESSSDPQHASTTS